MFLKNFKLLSRVNNNLLIKNINLKFFSGSHGNVTHNSIHDNHGQASTPHGESNHDHHDHDDHHGHHEITGEVDFQKVYLPVNSQMKRYISLTGTLHNNREVHKVIEGDMKARNSVTPIPIPLISRNRVFYKDLANVSYEENTYFHPEPYGYLISDDPWDPNPQTWQPTMVLLMGFALLLLMSKIMRMGNQDKTNIVEEVYHAHYTANLIEDEIRKIRKLDYPYRSLYDNMKNEM